MGGVLMTDYKPLSKKKKWLQKDFKMINNMYGEPEPSFKNVEGFELDDIVSAVDGFKEEMLEKTKDKKLAGDELYYMICQWFPDVV